ncbi:hypothetical protein GCM10007304_47440 [Rhodococcoides trifolii]|uniref:Uncharacterized protein n=1 Tax=Rhodococcoides trifolii TaxID=908250 RepID=A0A917G8G4_9NOCA|nr:hypothetical protein [Rhodococcus trifolii]GGG28119.1 hypothetical protein GCM10007304_47440 [Rhodococcus trifolii]
MIPYLLVALGGAAGTGLHYAATNYARWASERVVVVANLTASALLGVLMAIGPRESILALVGLGFLAAAAPFTALGIEAAKTEGPGKLRRVVMGVGSNIVAGAAVALLGYLSIRFGVVLYRKIR